jgi:hypothetical protein
VNRKQLAVVLFVVPDRIGWRVGGFGGGQGHAEGEGWGLLCGACRNGRETRGREGRGCGGEGRGVVEGLACVGAVYTAVEGRNEIRQRDHVRGTVQGRGYLLVETHGLAALKTAVFVEHGGRKGGQSWRERVQEEREGVEGSGFK